jgi:hypothetical protein
VFGSTPMRVSRIWRVTRKDSVSATRAGSRLAGLAAVPMVNFSFCGGGDDGAADVSEEAGDDGVVVQPVSRTAAAAAPALRTVRRAGKVLKLGLLGPANGTQLSLACEAWGAAGRYPPRSRHCFISHDLAVVRLVADYVCVMKDGELVEAASADEVLANPRHPYTRRLMPVSGPKP